jgi:uncharacterized protein
MLSWPENPREYDDAELDRIHQEHLAHHDQLRASGQVVTNGPVIDPPYPAVLTGRLTVEIVTWHCPPGTMSKPGQAVTV